MGNRYKLPDRTEQSLTRHIAGCKNLSLIMDKYPPWEVVSDTKNKGPWLQLLVREGHVDTTLTQAVYNRWCATMKAMKATAFKASPDWRMIIGLGGETILETDLTLHHLYGIPYIPASALKGLTRGYVAGEKEEFFVPEDNAAKQLAPSKEVKSDHKEIKRIFGEQEQAGTVIFFDAIPLDGNFKLVLDIMNPHYPDYYGKGHAPSNDQSPNPITFLTVTSTIFIFALAPRNPNNEQHKADVKKVKEWLQEALQKYGIGGKTSAGYGYFQQASDVDLADLTALKPEAVQASQISSTQATTPAPSPQQSWQRPNIPQFQAGAQIQNCVVIEPTEAMRQSYPKANAFLRYNELSPKYAYIVIDESFLEAQTWKPKESKSCIFIREEQREDSLVLICKPKAK